VLIVFTGVVWLAMTDRARRRTDARHLLRGAVLAALIAGPWHAVQLVVHGREFLHSYVIQNAFEKTLTSVDGNAASRRFYFVMLWRGFLGWSVLFIPALGLVAWRAIRQRDRRAVMLTAWIVVPFALFAAARTTLAWYLLPIYPALAIATAWLLVGIVPRRLQAAAVATALVATLVWNARSLEPLTWTSDVKTLGGCVARATPPTETIGYFDPDARYQGQQRRFWNVRPSVRFYAARPMIALVTRADLDRWRDAGGRWIWMDRADDLVDAPTLPLAARVGSSAVRGPGLACP
jgi:hypothetical protein